MARLVFDVEGKRFEYVRWPGRSKTLPVNFLKENFQGALVVALVSRYAEDRPPVLEDILVIQPKLEFKETEES